MRITVKCPECLYPATFETNGVHEDDARMLINIDGRACRYCGAWLIPLERCCRG